MESKILDGGKFVMKSIEIEDYGRFEMGNG